MSCHSFRTSFVFPAVALLGLAATAHALQITSGPFFTPAPNAPLAGVLELTTDGFTRVTVTANDGTDTWQRNFYDSGTHHWLPLFGFKPDRTNEISVTVHDQYGEEAVSAPVEFITAPLPANFPRMTVLKREPEKMEPGYTLFRTWNLNDRGSYLVAVDNSGEVVWYSGVPASFEVRQLTNGDLLLPMLHQFVEVNMLGETVKTLNLPADLPYNHEAFPTDHGTVLYLSDATRVIPDFPTSSTDPNAPLATTNVLHNPVIELSWDTGQVLNEWVTLDMLDPRRVTYFTFGPSGGGRLDIQHANAVIQDPRDDSVIVSIRHQNAIIKFSRQTGQLKWILGPHAGWGPEFQQYLLTPVGTPFGWNYGQHAPMLTPSGTLLVYDNGNFRASPFDEPPVPDASNYTRAVEYAIDEDRMEVRQVWEYGKDTDERMFTPQLGDADQLDQTGNVLVTFGAIRFINGLPPISSAPHAATVRIQEVTHEAKPEVVFDLSVSSYSDVNSNSLGLVVYRSDRVPDLYPVTTVEDSLESLINTVETDNLPNGPSLVASLLTAGAYVEWGNSAAAIRLLQALQVKALIQVNRRDPEAAAHFIHLNQQAIDLISAEYSQRLGPSQRLIRVQSLRP